ncbi:DNA-binding SARP family transcriptional activator [Allocatelliglobosispora scoriae]|uniref:DNA-binding SARP family transcriptional activator n=1 Tax=Allocatelliglobosispora scoriae TaxID=643052 RepID=A0A841C2L0_9ACTN|nr:BTAD domain-containing putative transcriptional regulator [Allocatelliglobosispora scoriae]MBB5873998.1 DNA-binding SARP family transcriptional activator [Allocatelliglobosispora scoriae]
MVRFKLLGPVEVRTDDDTLIDIGPPRQRTVLAALAVDAGRPVLLDTLIDRVWGPAPPQRARHALYVYISHLRTICDELGGGEVALLHRSRGYVLETDLDRVDTHLFRSLLAQARAPQLDDEQRAALLRRALRLWRGNPLADITGDWADRVREGWTQQRSDAVLRYAAIELRLGEPQSGVDMLTDLVADNPLAEPPVAALMRALHAAGRHAEALECYTELRTRLVTGLGVEPGDEVSSLHRALLRGEVEAPARTPAAPAAAVPAQLPLDLRGFTGRDHEIAQLDALAGGDGGSPATMAIATLSGTAGVGKTTLAVHWAHRQRQRFPDGQLYVNLRGFDPTGAVMTTAEAMRGFLDALGVAPQRVPPGVETQSALLRSLLAGRRVLMLLDNARDADQVRPLLPGAPGCMVLVTSRQQLTGLITTEGARPITLDVLSHDDARRLLVRLLGPDRVAAEPDATDEIIQRCARLPLALGIIAARATVNTGFALAALAAELRESPGGLDALAGSDPATDIRVVLSWSYRTLTAPAARLFRLLGLHTGPDISAAAAASLTETTSAAIRPLLAELTRAHLVIEHAPGRFTQHDLLRAYAAELTGAHDRATERREALLRLLGHYVLTGHRATVLLNPHRNPIDIPDDLRGVTWVAPETIADDIAAKGWFSREMETVLAAIDQAAAAGLHDHVSQLAWTIADFLDRQGHWNDMVAIHHTALASATISGDLPGQARAHHCLAVANARYSRYDEAHQHVQHAFDIFARLGDDAGRARAHFSRAWLYEQRGDYAQALAHDTQALQWFRAAGHRVGQANALNGIGWCHTQLGDHRAALDHCRQALALHEEIGDRYGQSHAWDSIGFAHHQLGEHADAARCFQRAIDLRREDGDRSGEAKTLVRLGDAHESAGERREAVESWRDALKIFDDLGVTDGEAGELRRKLGRA